MKLINRNSGFPEQLDHLEPDGTKDGFLDSMEEEAKKLAPADAAESFMLLGLKAACEGDLEKMRKNFKAALEEAPDDPAILQNFGQCLAKHGLYSEAIGCLQKLPQADGCNCDTLGLCCQALGLNAKARQYLENGSDRGEIESARPDCSCSANEAIAKVLASFDEDSHIWKSLSTR